MADATGLMALMGLSGLSPEMQAMMKAQMMMGGLSGLMQGMMPTTNIQARSPLYGLASAMQGATGGFNTGMQGAQAVQKMQSQAAQDAYLKGITDMIRDERARLDKEREQANRIYRPTGTGDLRGMDIPIGAAAGGMTTLPSMGGYPQTYTPPFGGISPNPLTAPLSGLNYPLR